MSATIDNPTIKRKVENPALNYMYDTGTLRLSRRRDLEDQIDRGIWTSYNVDILPDNTSRGLYLQGLRGRAVFKGTEWKDAVGTRLGVYACFVQLWDEFGPQPPHILPYDDRWGDFRLPIDRLNVQRAHREWVERANSAAGRTGRNR